MQLMGKSRFGIAVLFGVLACSGKSSLGSSHDATTGVNADGGTTGGTSGSGSGGSGNSGAGGSGAPECTSDDQCPQPGCAECPDRTQLCPRNLCIEGRCVGDGARCPEPLSCATPWDCPAYDAICEDCGDGTASCPNIECQHGICVLWQPPCGTVGTLCGGRRCGDVCHICGPLEDCVFPFSTCNASGECVGGQVVCD
jgi:hypothetical protein